MPTREFRELVEALPVERQRKIADRVRVTLASMPLDEIRKARQMTQAKLAEVLGVNQGEISKIEHRTDLYVSTLADYVEALGGKLEIRAVFPDREMRIAQFEELKYGQRAKTFPPPPHDGRIRRTRCPGRVSIGLHVLHSGQI
jgi:transcriptional regulator with XRE-family HTH domain